MKIADHLEMLELSMCVMGMKRIVYPTVMWDAANVILVDTGVPTSLETIKKQMEVAGTSFAKLNMIIASQQDIDHVAGIRGILKESPQVRVLAHEEDRPYIQGDRKVKRLNSKFMERIKGLPEEERLSVINMFENSSVKVNRALSDGEMLPYCGGITVIHTPGHTPGHVCLYHQKSKTLIAGDAMNILDGQLVGPNKDPMSEDDVNANDAINSLGKLKDYDIENVVTYHGGLFNNRPNEAIEGVIRERRFFSYRVKN
ncbi:MAG: MBL fold metallo-hydrolase [Terracidiphilus sp.]|jgi:glyoxylase-like metal-dependent hydrolase (beta-lactamase superfamily II)